MSELSIRPEVLTLLARLVEEKTGIHYGARDLHIFDTKVSMRARDAGFSSALDYYYFLRYDDELGIELAALVDVLVVGETFFFREADSLRAAIDEVVAPALEAGRRPRVWCAACATGEEPLTFAMLLEEAGLFGAVDLVASDISQRALTRAKEGVYNGRALRALPEEARRRWFTNGTNASGAHASIVAPYLSESIDWRRINLLDAQSIHAVGPCDLVICRNVLIYFSDATIAAVVESLVKTLRPGGRLLVGASESLLRLGTSLECEERRGAFFYRKVTT